MILRFIRRIIVLLILFTMIFLVYRYINPEGASKFVDKIKSVYEKFFDKDDVIVVDNENQLTGSIKNEAGEMTSDMDWLEELNKEIEEILANTNNDQDNGEIQNDLIVEETPQNSQELILDTGDNDDSINTGEIFITKPTNTGENNSSSSNQNQTTVKWGDCGEGLTQKECDEMRNIFGNLIE